LSLSVVCCAGFAYFEAAGLESRLRSFFALSAQLASSFAPPIILAALAPYLMDKKEGEVLYFEI